MILIDENKGYATFYAHEKHKYNLKDWKLLDSDRKKELKIILKMCVYMEFEEFQRQLARNSLIFSKKNRLSNWVWVKMESQDYIYEDEKDCQIIIGHKIIKIMINQVFLDFSKKIHLNVLDGQTLNIQHS